MFKDTFKAIFLSRPNRFTICCDFCGKKIKAYLPDTGRLWELLLPGTEVYIQNSNAPGRKIPYTAVAVRQCSFRGKEKNYDYPPCYWMAERSYTLPHHKTFKNPLGSPEKGSKRERPRKLLTSFPSAQETTLSANSQRL